MANETGNPVSTYTRNAEATSGSTDDVGNHDAGKTLLVVVLLLPLLHALLLLVLELQFSKLTAMLLLSLLLAWWSLALSLLTAYENDPGKNAFPGSNDEAAGDDDSTGVGTNSGSDGRFAAGNAMANEAGKNAYSKDTAAP